MEAALVPRHCGSATWHYGWATGRTSPHSTLLSALSTYVSRLSAHLLIESVHLLKRNFKNIASPTFADNGVPAILVGVLLLALCLDVLWAGAICPSREYSATRTRVITVLCGILISGACIGYAYWGVPFVHGMYLSSQDTSSREWIEQWSTRLPPGVKDVAFERSRQYWNDQ